MTLSCASCGLSVERDRPDARVVCDDCRDWRNTIMTMLGRLWSRRNAPDFYDTIDVQMQRKLDEPVLVEILKTRVVIARQLKVIQISQIAKGFDISGMTLYRYENPFHRAKSLEYGKRQVERLREQNWIRSCARCHAAVTGHARCRSCGILIHGEEAVRGTCSEAYCIVKAESRTMETCPS